MAEVEELDVLLNGDEVGVISDGIAEDSDLSESFTKAKEEVDAEAAELLTVTKTDIENLDIDDEFEEEEDNGTFDEAEQKVELDEDEEEKLDTTEKKVTQNTNKFRAFLKSVYTSMKSFITSSVGLACIEAIGTYFKYYFILEIVSDTLTSVETIVSNATTDNTSYTDDQQSTADTLTSYISFLTSMYDITSSVGDSLQNACTFGTGDDSDETSAAYLAGNMTTNNFKTLMSVTEDALDASNTLLLNISSAINALGYSSDVDSDDFVNSIIYNPTLLTNSFDELDVDSIDDFKTAVTTYKSTTSQIISDTYTDQTEIDTVTAFFYISDGWDTTADSLETFVTSAESTSLT